MKLILVKDLHLLWVDKVSATTDFVAIGAENKLGEAFDLSTAAFDLSTGTGFIST